MENRNCSDLKQTFDEIFMESFSDQFYATFSALS